MGRTANVFARVEPEVKAEAEAVLGELGVPMSNAIGMFLRQVALQRGMPFEVKLPDSTLAVSSTRAANLALGSLTKAEVDAVIQAGIDDIEAGSTIPATEVERRLRATFGL
ncbi:type II toxin-antitoxin system RelB/DinJ family antitoxin [Mobiluncus mulieris]|uniref:type II toxin-antitoxin system RelB/DinJ family antitoxin n=1 Tax=Mobiluncus mulieris TaxID=2052 RepID=UPI000B63EE36|nr:type II toxin-antitoxin system RelB/DinJ family antitoxin [Mobiluncus mulieris]PNL43160.1 type II toxin-antitoxin system antitoxin, RelB/DinJ family [Mobiluncus mulieris]